MKEFHGRIDQVETKQLMRSRCPSCESSKRKRERIEKCIGNHRVIRREHMKTHYFFALAMLVGFAFGAVAVQGLHAQAKPPVYYVAEVEVTDLDGYMKEFAPKAAASSKAYGGRTLAAGEKITAIEGAPPKRRVVIVLWESLEQLQAWRNSAQYKEDRKIGDKYATVRAFAVEGLPQ
jgi:uncharacterized protein (DUF1330 family)